jgi:hypothetical protein
MITMAMTAITMAMTAITRIMITLIATIAQKDAPCG